MRFSRGALRPVFLNAFLRLGPKFGAYRKVCTLLILTPSLSLKKLASAESDFLPDFLNDHFYWLLFSAVGFEEALLAASKNGQSSKSSKSSGSSRPKGEAPQLLATSKKKLDNTYLRSLNPLPWKPALYAMALRLFGIWFDQYLYLYFSWTMD
jgi:hypothetical protein